MTAADLTTLTKAFGDPLMWRTIGISAAFGMLGGLAHKLGAPTEDKTSPAGYLLLGMVSGIGVLYVNTATDPLKVIALSVVAGYAGKALLAALQARIEAEVAKRQTAEAKDAVHQVAHEGKECVDLARQYVRSIHEHGEKIRAVVAKHPEKAVNSIFSSLRLDVAGPLNRYLDPGHEPAEGPALAEHDLLQQLTDIRGRIEGIEKTI